MKARVTSLISELISYATSHNLIPMVDEAYTVSNLMDVLDVDEIGDLTAPAMARPIAEILSDACDLMEERGYISGISERDRFDTKLMAQLTPKPSEVLRKFGTLRSASPKDATDYFYKLSGDVNYIRRDRIARDLKWTYDSDYGTIDVTVNLSKPEKDPRAIAAAKNAPQTSYPKCALCHENEGFRGTATRDARGNLRQIPLFLDGEGWFMQYSPYVYYNEHCIVLSREHRPMRIDRSTFARLFDFLHDFPHYFIGSNADLKIVGGSILSHDHMQGGRYEFAMDRAEVRERIEFLDFPTVDACILKWPMSVIRLTSLDREALTDLSERILNAWRSYSDPSVSILSESDGEPHNTITPIARRRGELFELDLVLRNNRTSEEHPLGIFHPHAERHNIKKENIGLIEVMGLAVLPARLKSELERVGDAIESREDISSIPEIAKHKEWVDSFRAKYDFTRDDVAEVIRREVGATFVEVLRDCAVFKETDEGISAFHRFIDSVK